MNVRRWLLVGGASILGVAAFLAPAGSQADPFTTGYQGTINGSPTGGTVEVTQVNGVCTINASQFVGVVNDTQGRKLSGIAVIAFAVVATNGTTPANGTTSTPVISSSPTGVLPFTETGTRPISGAVVPCGTTFLTATFTPACSSNGSCQSDTVNAPVNRTYVS